MPRGKTVARGKGVKRRRTARVTDNDRTAALSQTEHDVVPPRTQITTSNASGPSTTFNSSVDLPNNEESYSQTINEQGVVLDSLLDNPMTVDNEDQVLIQGQLSDSSDQLST
ncbi:Hypothetical predicted protein, partial [Mytilus galloprovincialis]